MNKTDKNNFSEETLLVGLALAFLVGQFLVFSTPTEAIGQFFNTAHFGLISAVDVAIDLFK